MAEMQTVQVMLCSKGTVTSVTRVDEHGRVRSVIWQRPVALEEGPFSLVHEVSPATTRLEGEIAPHKPAPFKPSTGAVVVALEAARFALISNNNCLITDRPDLPLSQETSWTTDFSSELALIDAAIGRTASLCANESTCLQTAPKSSPAKSEQELRSSRSPDQDRL